VFEKVGRSISIKDIKKMLKTHDFAKDDHITLEEFEEMMLAEGEEGIPDQSDENTLIWSVIIIIKN